MDTTSPATTENSIENTDTFIPKVLPYSRASLVEKWDQATTSDVVAVMPAWIGHQREAVAYMASRVREVDGLMEKERLLALIGWEQHFPEGKEPSKTEKDAMAEYISKDKWEEKLNKAKLNKDLAAAGLEYLEDLFVSRRKLCGTDDQTWYNLDKAQQ